jgi:hypothetical protein
MRCQMTRIIGEFIPQKGKMREICSDEWVLIQLIGEMRFMLPVVQCALWELKPVTITLKLMVDVLILVSILV